MTSPSPRDIAASLKRSRARTQLLVAVRRAERPNRWDDRTPDDRDRDTRGDKSPVVRGSS